MLVVEDDPAIRALIVATLTEDGYRVAAVDDGAAALEYVRHLSPGLIVLDLSMPIMDGRAFLSAYRELVAQPAPVVVCTALTHPEEEARLVGADACLPKPFDLDDLAAVVRKLLPGPRPRQTRAARALSAAG